MNLMEFMCLNSFEQWYKKDVSPNLDDETKLTVAKKISELSLREPIFLPGKEYPHKMFPELVPFSHTKNFSGMQLYAVFTEIMRERGLNTPSASQIALKKKE
jgi:hypothetical protein